MRFKTQNLVIRLERGRQANACVDCTCTGPTGCTPSTPITEDFATQARSLLCLAATGATSATLIAALEERISELENLLKTDRGRELSLEAQEAQLEEAIEALRGQKAQVSEEREALRKKREEGG